MVAVALSGVPIWNPGWPPIPSIIGSLVASVTVTVFDPPVNSLSTGVIVNSALLDSGGDRHRADVVPRVEIG